MLTTQKAAQKLNSVGLQYSAQDVAELARKGILAGSEKSGNVWLIPEESLEKFILQQKDIGNKNPSPQLSDRKKSLKEFLRDPIWQGIGAIFAAIPIVWGLILYFNPYKDSTVLPSTPSASSSTQTVEITLTPMPSSSIPSQIIAATSTFALQTSEPIAKNISAISGRQYVLQKCGIGDLYYIDKEYTIVSFSNSNYTNLACIKTSNANLDKENDLEEFLKFTLTRPATIYIYFDRRVQRPPTWTTNLFTPVNEDKVYVSDSDMDYFQIYACDSSAGEIVLGGPKHGEEVGGKSMYVVAFKEGGNSGKLCSTAQSVLPAKTVESTTNPRGQSTPVPIPIGTIFNFETTTQGWDTDESRFKLAGLSVTMDQKHSGRQSLLLTTELVGDKSNDSRASESIYYHTVAKVYFSYARQRGVNISEVYDITDKKVSCYVFFPKNFVNQEYSPIVRMMVKDENSHNDVSQELFVDANQAEKWLQIVLQKGTNDYPDNGFNYTKVTALGVFITLPTNSSQIYKGPIYIDDCAIN